VIKMIPDDVLAVASVVLGEETAHLLGWQMRDAMAAMTALGQSRKHIAWALQTSEQMVYNVCRELGIRSHQFDQAVDVVGVEMVVSGAGRLPLMGEDRNEALRQMAAAEVRLDVIARRLCAPIDTVRIAARRLGLQLSSAPDGFDWKHMALASSASVRRLEGADPNKKTRRPLPERRVQKAPAKQRPTLHHDHRTTEDRQDTAA
jgi:hypothetical protein